MLLELLVLGALALFLLYRWVTANNDFFEKRGIPYSKPFFLFGNLKDAVFGKRAMFDIIVDLYKAHDGCVYGVFDQRLPLLLIRDPELIKQITIKDFDHFVNHRTIFGKNEEGEKNLFANSLFSMHDGKWKDMRSTLSPVFTGSKMRQMFQLINQVSEETIKTIKKNSENNMAEGLELDFKDYCTRFTNDIIASTAFGLQVNSLKDKDNKFYQLGKKVTTFNTWTNIKFMLYMYCKWVMKILRLELFDKEATNYFTHLVLDAMKYRIDNNIHRPDMINMLMEARGLIKTDHPKSHNREWTDTEIVAQCFLFFFAGFDTSAVLICFTAHELMENPEVQERLREEVDDVIEQLDGAPLTYEALQGMKYLDMVISEVLRKWPAAIAIDRTCNKDIVYERDGQKIEIKAGEVIWMPVCGIHRDPKYFENPDKFDPERFSDENKDKIAPFTYFPFGVGPRNCIGSRFALLEAKAMIFYLVRNYRIEAAKNTTMPMKLSAKGFQLAPKTGFWLKFTARNRN